MNKLRKKSGNNPIYNSLKMKKDLYSRVHRFIHNNLKFHHKKHQCIHIIEYYPAVKTYEQQSKKQGRKDDILYDFPENYSRIVPEIIPELLE
jgi:hypothetical protein